ncbi:MAG: glutamyl-tRNA reductase, partial [Vulcanisaeta sp.]
TVRALSLSSLDNELRSNRYDVMVVAISTKSPLIIIDDHNYNMPNLIIDVSEPSAVEVRNNSTRLIKLEDLREPYLKYINGKGSILNRLDDINQEAERIMRLILRSDAEDLVRDVMRFIEDIRKEEVREAVNALMSGHDPRDVIEAMSKSLIKKLMHNYLENMRKLVEIGNELEAEKLRNYLIKIP